MSIKYYHTRLHFLILNVMFIIFCALAEQSHNFEMHLKEPVNSTIHSL